METPLEITFHKTKCVNILHEYLSNDNVELDGAFKIVKEVFDIDCRAAITQAWKDFDKMVNERIEIFKRDLFNRFWLVKNTNYGVKYILPYKFNPCNRYLFAITLENNSVVTAVKEASFDMGDPNCVLNQEITFVEKTLEEVISDMRMSIEDKIQYRLKRIKETTQSNQE